MTSDQKKILTKEQAVAAAKEMFQAFVDAERVFEEEKDEMSLVDRLEAAGKLTGIMKGVEAFAAKHGIPGSDYKSKLQGTDDDMVDKDSVDAVDDIV